MRSDGYAIINELAFALYRVVPEKTLRLTAEAKAIAETINYISGKAEGIRIEGIYHWQKADYTEVQEHFTIA